MSAKTTQKEAVLVEIVEGLTDLAIEQEKALMAAAVKIMEQDFLLEMATEVMLDMDAKLSLAQVIIPALAAEVQAYEQKEQDAAKLATKLKIARGKPQLANLPVNRSSVYLEADGVAAIVDVRPGTRQMNSRTFFTEYGEPKRIEVTSTAKADVGVYLPFVGRVNVIGNLKYTDTCQAGSKRHAITNEIEFSFDIGGHKRNVRAVTSGIIWETDGDHWDYGCVVTVDGQPCEFCGNFHGEDLTFTGKIS